MADRLTVRCACGWQTEGPEEAVVAATREHGEKLHNMTATREQILAMASRPDAAEAGTAPDEAS